MSVLWVQTLATSLSQPVTTSVEPIFVSVKKVTLREPITGFVNVS